MLPDGQHSVNTASSEGKRYIYRGIREGVPPFLQFQPNKIVASITEINELKRGSSSDMGTLFLQTFRE